jgi:hypothetical protein
LKPLFERLFWASEVISLVRAFTLLVRLWVSDSVK